MSRLREAFEKARQRHAASTPAKADSATVSDSSELPQEWDFDLRPNDSDQATASTLVRFEAVEASAPVDAPEAGEEPDDVLDEQPQDSLAVLWARRRLLHNTWHYRMTDDMPSSRALKSSTGPGCASPYGASPIVLPNPFSGPYGSTDPVMSE